MNHRKSIRDVAAEEWRMSRVARFGGTFAMATFFAAAAVCGALLDGYSHREQPLASLGAAGVPHALAFNTCAFVLPGLSVAVVLWMMRSAMPAKAGWRMRIGMQLAVLSALAFAAQGVFPLNANDLGGQANALHALAWTLWWISFATAGILLAFGGMSHGFRWSAAVSAMAVLVFSLPPWPGAMAAFSPRCAYVVWFAWVAVAPRLITRPD
jgi:hypothetical membrane protein